MNDRVLWHASRAPVDCPTIAGRSAGDNHANSGLGLYCATHPHDYIAGFGPWVFRLEIAPSVRVLKWDIAQLAGLKPPSQFLDSDREWYESYGRKLGRQFDLVDIQEVDSRVEQSIVLNDQAIVRATRFTREQFLGSVATPRFVPGPPRRPR